MRALLLVVALMSLMPACSMERDPGLVACEDDSHCPAGWTCPGTAAEPGTCVERTQPDDDDVTADDDDVAPDDDDTGPDDDDATVDDDDTTPDDDDSSGVVDDDDDGTAVPCDLSWIVESADVVSFEDTIQPIFDVHCDPCHIVFSESDLSLAPGLSYGNLVNVPNSIPDALPWGNAIRVVPGDPVQSYMAHKWLGCDAEDPVWGYNDAPMPPAIGETIPLPDDKKSLLWSWIMQGALDN